MKGIVQHCSALLGSAQENPSLHAFLLKPIECIFKSTSDKMNNITWVKMKLCQGSKRIQLPVLQ